MNSQSIALAIAAAFFGVLVGWYIGSQQAGPLPASAPQPLPAVATADSAPAPALLDENEVRALRTAAERDPANPAPRTRLGDLYFDAGRFAEAIPWYEASLKIAPNDPNVSTDLGVCYYNLNQPDRALQQFERSLAVDPKHTTTLLNMGIVRAFGKQDLEGAAAVWERLIAMAPDSKEGQAAKQALERLRAAHPEVGADKTGPPPRGGR